MNKDIIKISKPTGYTGKISGKAPFTNSCMKKYTNLVLSDLDDDNKQGLLEVIQVAFDHNKSLSDEQKKVLLDNMRHGEMISKFYKVYCRQLLFGEKIVTINQEPPKFEQYLIHIRSQIQDIVLLKDLQIGDYIFEGDEYYKIKKNYHGCKLVNGNKLLKVEIQDKNNLSRIVYLGQDKIFSVSDNEGTYQPFDINNMVNPDGSEYNKVSIRNPENDKKYIAKLTFEYEGKFGDGKTKYTDEVNLDSKMPIEEQKKIDKYRDKFTNNILKIEHPDGAKAIVDIAEDMLNTGEVKLNRYENYTWLEFNIGGKEYKFTIGDKVALSDICSNNINEWEEPIRTKILGLAEKGINCNPDSSFDELVNILEDTKGLTKTDIGALFMYLLGDIVSAWSGKYTNKKSRAFVDFLNLSRRFLSSGVDNGSRSLLFSRNG